MLTWDPSERIGFLHLFCEDVRSDILPVRTLYLVNKINIQHWQMMTLL